MQVEDPIEIPQNPLPVGFAMEDVEGPSASIAPVDREAASGERKQVRWQGDRLIETQASTGRSR